MALDTVIKELKIEKKWSKHLWYIKLWFLFLYSCLCLHHLPCHSEVSSTKLHSVLPCSLTLDLATWVALANGRWIDMRQELEMCWNIGTCFLVPSATVMVRASSEVAADPSAQTPEWDRRGWPELARPTGGHRAPQSSPSWTCQPTPRKKYLSYFYTEVLWLLPNKNWLIEKSVPRSGVAAIMKT